MGWGRPRAAREQNSKKMFCTKYPAGRPNPSREGTQSGSAILYRLALGTGAWDMECIRYAYFMAQQCRVQRRARQRALTCRAFLQGPSPQPRPRSCSCVLFWRPLLGAALHQPKLMEDEPPGGALTLVVRLAVMKLPVFWCAPEAYEFEE